MDLPGFGWSSPSVHGYLTAERCRTVIAVMDELGIDKVDIIGHDWGAWLAFRVALEAPDRVRRLASICELHPWPLQRRLLPNLWRMWVTALFEIPALGSLVQTRRSVIRWFLSRDAGDRAVWTNELVDIYANPVAHMTAARAGQRLHAAFVTHDIARLVFRRDHRRPFTIPTLVLAGNHDTYIPPALMEVPRGREGTLHCQTIGGGHFLLDQNPGAVIAALQSHLRVNAVEDQIPNPLQEDSQMNGVSDPTR
jgi:pimeloyl-ACP methyl ester carboxylesterase